MQTGKANVIIDGQWGSTGKGKLAGYLALRNDIAAATCNFMSNAGHTWVGDGNNKIVTCQLPTSAVNRDAMLLINAGAAITIERLMKEIEMMNCADRLFIHPHAAIIKEEDRKHEAVVLERISSTLKGCGGSLSRKVMRVASLAKDEPALRRWISDTTTIVHAILESGGTVIAEGAQGFDLSLNHGNQYPWVTSRDITPMSILNDACIPIPYAGDVYGVIRTYPIRVGNTFDAEGKRIGWSGPCYGDQEEISWDDLYKSSGASNDLTERTTVTQKIRRVFTFSYMQLFRFIRVCRPTELFLNFVNHIDANVDGMRTWSDMSAPVQDFVYKLNLTLTNDATHHHYSRAAQVTLLGTGARDSDMVEVHA